MGFFGRLKFLIGSVEGVCVSYEEEVIVFCRGF